MGKLNRRSTAEEFVTKASIVHGNRYTYHLVEYLNNKTKVAITCQAHGEFLMTPHNHLGGKGCPKCSIYITGKTKDNFIREASEVHGHKYDYSKVEYVNCRTKVTVVCQHHGDFEITPINHLSNRHGCNKCSLENKKMPISEFIKKADEVHGHKYDYSKVEYVNCRTKVTVVCQHHGDFEITPTHHIQIKNGCPKCRRSKGETEIAVWLKKNNISFEEQKKFNGCKNIAHLRFDFFLPEYNLAIEYNGKQHYHNTYFGGLEERKRLDLLKRKYCFTNNIKLLEIKYTQNPITILNLIRCQETTPRT
jgi:very-short-patch-repair endonuclease